MTMATTSSSNFALGKHDGDLGPHSILYSDEPGAASESYTQGGTGFNHGEMVYNERRYDAGDDPDINDGAFRKGDPNPPMRGARIWIENDVFGNLN
jgi:hypothetical protein